MANVEQEHAQAVLVPGEMPDDQTQGGATPTSTGTNPILDDDQVDPAEYARLLDIYDNSFRNIAEGEVVKGTVLKVTDTEVVVDVGFKSEGIISIEEFLDETPADHRAARRHRRRAAREDRRPRRLRRPLARKSREDEDLGRSRARLHRQEGRHRPRHRTDQGWPCRRHRRAGVPARQPDRRAPRAQPRRPARPGAAHARHQGEQEARQHRALAQGAARGGERREEEAHARDARRGQGAPRASSRTSPITARSSTSAASTACCTSPTCRGAASATPPRSSRSTTKSTWSCSSTTRRPSASRSATSSSCPIPWSAVTERYPVSARVSGKVVSLTDYGAFIELEPGVEGLIHVSEMSWSKRVKHPSKILNVGDTVEAMVLGVDPAARRISLGLKQVEQNPWHDLADKYPVGTRIKGRVRNLTEFGAFVEVEDDIDGLIHISDMSWSKRIKHPSEVLKKGDVVEAMVLNIDAENQRLVARAEAARDRHLGRLLLAAPPRRHDRGQGRAHDQLRRIRRARRGHRGADPRVGVRRSDARRREDRSAGGRDLHR